MIKYAGTQVVFREFPDEVTLAIDLSLCPNHCIGCHSEYLRSDIGKPLTEKELETLIEENDGITCLGFMGGDNDHETLFKLFSFIKGHSSLKLGWYTGRDTINENILNSKLCDYIKVGHYDEKYGALDNPNTNQRMYELRDGSYVDITSKFYKE